LKHLLLICEAAVSILYFIDLVFIGLYPKLVPVSFSELTLVYLGSTIDIVIVTYSSKFIWRRLKGRGMKAKLTCWHCIHCQFVASGFLKSVKKWWHKHKTGHHTFGGFFDNNCGWQH